MDEKWPKSMCSCVRASPGGHPEEGPSSHSVAACTTREEGECQLRSSSITPNSAGGGFVTAALLFANRFPNRRQPVSRVFAALPSLSSGAGPGEGVWGLLLVRQLPSANGALQLVQHPL